MLQKLRLGAKPACVTATPSRITPRADRRARASLPADKRPPTRAVRLPANTKPATRAVPAPCCAVCVFVWVSARGGARAAPPPRPTFRLDPHQGPCPPGSKPARRPPGPRPPAGRPPASLVGERGEQAVLKADVRVWPATRRPR